MGQNFIADTVNRTLLFPPSLHEWLPEGHLARILAGEAFYPKRHRRPAILIRPDWNEPIFSTLAAKNAARMGHPA